MTNLDFQTIKWMNQYSEQSWYFDEIADIIAGNVLLKSMFITVIIWWLWFKASPDQKKNRITLISTLIASFFAESISKILGALLPFRLRPGLNPDLHFLTPYDGPSKYFNTLTSTPSDHATLYFGLAMGIYFVSKASGRLAFLFVLLIICLPRLYLGLHYPSDIILGGLIGVLTTYFVVKSASIQRISSKIHALSETRPEYFYPLLFVWSYQITDQFWELRELFKLIWNMLKH